jgi:hypothetical protein
MNSETIKKQVEEYLKKGGTIKRCAKAKSPKFTWYRDYAKYAREAKQGNVQLVESIPGVGHITRKGGQR